MNISGLKIDKFQKIGQTDFDETMMDVQQTSVWKQYQRKSKIYREKFEKRFHYHFPHCRQSNMQDIVLTRLSQELYTYVIKIPQS